MKTIKDTPGHLNAEEAKLGVQLVQRLRARTLTDGEVMTLDLRHGRFGGLGRLTMYRPGDAGWPHAGITTSKAAIATDWIMQQGGYAQYVHRRLSADSDVNSHLSVAAAGTVYVEHLKKQHGPQHNTYINRKSAVHAHIAPAFGATPLLALSRSAVRRFLQKLTTLKAGLRVEAALRTKENTYQALLAIWRFTYPDTACPFTGISLEDTATTRVRRERIIAGEIHDVVPDKTYDSGQILLLLLTAMWWDAHVHERPCQRTRQMPLTAEAIAIGLGTGQRIAEQMRWRWKHLLPDEGVAFVPGTKNHNAWRLIPLQVSLMPWIDAIERKATDAGRVIQSTDHVLQMRAGEENRERTDAKTLIRRVGDVMRMAGLKIAGKATHAARATHATLGGLQSVLVDLPSLQSYLGHEAHGGGATEVYMNRSHLRMVIEKMPEAHRQLIQLPSPAEVAALLPKFVPPGMRSGKFTMLQEWRAAGRPGA